MTIIFMLLQVELLSNPSELVLSDLVDEIILYAKDNFDYLFIDTPPIGFISDGLSLSSKVD